MPEIICISTSPWNFMFQRPQQLMSLFSQDYKIGYINTPIKSKRFLTYEEILQKHTKVINPNIVVLNPRTPSILSHHNASKYFLGLLRAFCKRFGFQEIILWICLPQFEFLCGHLEEKLVIYDCHDDYASFSWTAATTLRDDIRLTEKADIVLTVSQPQQKLKKKTNKLCYLVPNGCDFQHFNKAKEFPKAPKDMFNIERPRIGFVGAIYEWIDLDLVKMLAENEPNWSLVMVGPVRSNVKPPIRSNIYYPGRKSYLSLPNYIGQFDVCIIPFIQTSPISVNSCPIKLYEYMAAGKPIVSTNLPAVNFAKRAIEIASDHKDFHQKIKGLLVEDPLKAKYRLEKQLCLARANTWWARYKTIKLILNKFI